MNITEKLQAIKARYKKARRKLPTIGQLKAWLHSHRGHRRHHPCVARGTSTKNTRSNRWNVRGRKNVRQDSRFAKLRAFKNRYGIS